MNLPGIFVNMKDTQYRSAAVEFANRTAAVGNGSAYFKQKMHML